MLNSAANLVKEGIKFGATEGAKKLVIFGLGAKELAIGAAVGVGGAIGGSKIFKACKGGIKDLAKKTKEKADQIVKDAKKEMEEKNKK